MRTVERDEVQRLMRTGEDVVLLEVLGHDHYEKGHLPGALNAPVDERFDERMERLVPETERPVVVYSDDRGDEAASRRAAARLDALGYEHVFLYEGGKRDWREAGLEIETGPGQPQPPLPPKHPRGAATHVRGQRG